MAREDVIYVFDIGSNVTGLKQNPTRGLVYGGEKCVETTLG
jgi:hypothetical protein